MSYYNLGFLSKKRNIIYSIAIIWIVFFHSTFELNWKWFYPLAQIKNIGNIGVDIFLMISGMSLFFSIEKYSSVRQFYAKRLKRILVPSLLVGIPYFFVEDMLSGTNRIIRFLLDISGISFFTTGLETIWFIVAILIMYMIYPWLYKLFKKADWSVFCLIGCIAVYELFNISFKMLNGEIWNNSEMLLSRVPVFIIGTYIGKFVKEKKVLKIKEWQVVTAGMISVCILVAVRMFLPIYAYRISCTVLSLPIAMAFSVLGKIKITDKPAALLSAYTLEIYLLHEKMVVFCTDKMSEYHYVIINICAIILTAVFVFLLKKVENIVFKVIERPKKESDQVAPPEKNESNNK